MSIIPSSQSDINKTCLSISDNRQTADIQTANNVLSIPLTRNYTTLIDSNHFNLINGYIWYANTCSGLMYASTNIRKSDGTRTILRLHTLLWESLRGPIPNGLMIDHINGNTLDNRLSNLRLATPRLNALNRKDRRNGSTQSKLAGTYLTTSGKYSARIKVHGKLICLGSYPDELSAHHAYIAYANSLNEGVIYG
jgi:hypothetical protein